MEPTLLQLSLGLLQNAALLVLGVLGYCWLRGPMSRWRRRAREPAEGLIGALLVVLCMTNPFWLMPGVQLDSRNAIIALATVFGGPVAGLMTTVAAAAYRSWIGGIGAAGGAADAIGSYAVSLPFWYWLNRRGMPLGYRHIATLALAIAAVMLVGLPLQPTAVAIEMLQRAGVPGLTIVPGSVFVLGAILLRFERARAAERKVIESEARLRAIVDNLPDALSIRDRDSRFVLVNNAYERAAGFSASDLVGHDTSMVGEGTGGGQAVAAQAREVWRTGEGRRSPPLPLTYRGQQYSVVVTSFPIRDARGEIDSVGAIMTNVTDLVQAREELEQRRANLRRHEQALIDIVRASALMERPVAFSEAVRAITEVAGDAMGVEYTTVFETDFDAGVARCIDDWSRTAARHRSVPQVELRDFGDLIRDIERLRVIAVEDIQNDARFAVRRDMLKTRDGQSGVLAGIYLGTLMRGYVVFVSKGSKRQWSEEDTAFARSIADLIGLMYLTSQLREALAALDLVSDIIYVEREDGQVIYANGPALALAGLSGASRARPGAAGAFPRPAERLARERDAQEITWTIGGAVRDLAVRRAKLPDGGVVTVIEDITAKKVELRDRERMQLHLQQASKMEAIGQLAGGIAHDFNNLLGAVIGFARFLEQDLSPGSPQRQFAQRILSACNRGKDLVAQILSFTRARAVERHPLDLRNVLAEARELLSGSLPATTRLAVEPGSVPLTVHGNDAQLQQVLVNLCLNAHDALGGGPGEIRVTLARLRPGAADYRRPLIVGRLDDQRRYARLDVIDTGAGIPAENLPRLFEPFFTTKERGRGTGLGLAVAHGIITSYDGACGVESRSNLGTRFSVYLPLVEQTAIAQPDDGERHDLRGRERLLVVDDEADITDMLSIGLERLGYEVAALNDPAEALDVFGEEPAAWDAVITDQLMPGMQGLALAERLKALRPDLIVILCTGLDDGVIARSAKLRGIDAFFTKPVEPEQIAAAIRDLSGG